MPLAKGEPWGEPAPAPPGIPVFDDDASASRAVQFSRQAAKDLDAIGLVGGDLWRTLGAPPGGEERLKSGPATRAVVDVGWVDLGEFGVHCFVAHLVARSRFWSQVVAVMNAEWLSEWDVAPRSHPGDGRLDIFEASLPWPDRAKVRDRLPTGTHLPHPQIRTFQAPDADFELERPLRLRLDGAPFPRVWAFSVWAEPASLTVYV